MAAEKPAKSTGRPSVYTAELAEAICAEIASGLSLRSICKAKGMPTDRTVFRWLASNETFCQQYARATEARTNALAEEILDIADGTGADTNRARLRVDTRKWLMSKMAPKKYGDRTEHRHSGPNGGPIPTVDLTNMSDDDLNRLEALFGPLAGAAGDDAEADQSREGAEGEGS